MNSEIKTRWVAALRSGDYTQGQEKLMTDEGTFCCLGVLAVIENVPRVDGKFVFGGHEREELNKNGLIEFKSNHIIPDDYAEIPYHEKAHLMQMNDRGVSFTEIADHIEKNL